jgi:hypothetical protein
LLGDGETGIEILYGDEKRIFMVPTKVAKAEQKSLVQHDKPNEPTKEGPLSFVLVDSPFPWVSTVSRDHTSLVSEVLVRHRKNLYGN